MAQNKSIPRCRPVIILTATNTEKFISFIHETRDEKARQERKRIVQIFRENNQKGRHNNMLLKNASNIEALIAAVAKCKGDVILRSVDGKEEFNLKSTLSQYIAIGKLVEDHGDRYEVFCMNREDETYMLQFFHELISESRSV